MVAIPVCRQTLRSLARAPICPIWRVARQGGAGSLLSRLVAWVEREIFRFSLARRDERTLSSHIRPVDMTILTPYQHCHTLTLSLSC